DRRTIGCNLKIVHKTSDFYYHAPRPGQRHLLTPRDVCDAEVALANGSAWDAS
ncbi:hypothetical protein K466DRAFT_446771, partial [Polyporus arcularius HHB13444]